MEYGGRRRTRRRRRGGNTEGGRRRRRRASTKRGGGLPGGFGAAARKSMGAQISDQEARSSKQNYNVARAIEQQKADAARAASAQAARDKEWNNPTLTPQQKVVADAAIARRAKEVADRNTPAGIAQAAKDAAATKAANDRLLANNRRYGPADR